MEKQQTINEEITKAKIHEQTKLNAMVEKKIQQEEEWLVRKIQTEKEAKEGMSRQSSIASGTTESVQSVKLQKYITGCTIWRRL